MGDDITKLKKEIERLKKAVKKQKYGLVWMDVPEAFEDDVENKLPILKEVPGLAIKNEDGKPTHILIEGDNYHALTCLNYTHKGKIDVIYIDPPYNTGSDGFKYKDKRILDKFPDGTEVPKDHPFRHSYWLSFMNKRLELAKTLLKNDGIILISIDDNETAQLKLLCDEIFGEENRLSTHHVQVRYADKTLNEKNDWQPVMEYVFIYAKKSNSFKANKPSVEYSLDKFVYEIKELTQGAKISVKNRNVKIFKKGEWQIIKHKVPADNLLKEIWVSGSIYSGTGNGAMVRNIIEPRMEVDGYGSLYKIEGLGEDGLGYRYFVGPQKIGANRSKMYMGVPTVKLEEINNGNGAMKFKSIPNIYDFSPDFGNIRHEGGIGFNSGKKPVKMLKQLISYHQNKNVIVLDFFAGSGSTAQAVLELNEEDGGKRQIIVNTDNESKIMTDFCYPRIKNVIKGYNNTKALGNSIKYYKTEFIGKNNILDATDEDKIELAHNAGELLAVAENTLELVKQNKYYQLFEDGNKKRNTAVYFREEQDEFNNFIEMVKKLNKETTVYVFSWGDEEKIDDFAGIKEIKVKTIPLPILEIYKQIYNLSTQ